MAEKGCFASDLYALLESGAGADVTLVVSETELPAHSVILAARSPVFAAMLRNEMREAGSRRIQISGVGETALRQMLWFIYTDTAPQLESVAAELLAAADKYDVPLLKKRCEQQMVRGIGVDNAAASAALAVLHRCPELKSAAVEFVAEHPEVLATEGWERMMRDTVAAGVEVCRQLAATARPQSATKRKATDLQAPDSSIVPKEKKQKMTTKLIEAASNGWTREVWALLAGGADTDARDSSGNTALHLAAANGHTSTVKCLLDEGMDVNAVNSNGQMPLHMAAEKGDTNIIWMLVAASARIDALDNQGQTALHVAAQKKIGNIYDCNDYDCYSHEKRFDPAAVLNVLLLTGARTDVKNLSGETPKNVATSATKSAFKDYNNM